MKPLPLADLLGALPAGRIRPPVAVVLGSPRETSALVAALGTPGVVCYQLDVYQAERLDAELREIGVEARVETAADLWDLPADFQTVVYPAAHGGERGLKIDMLEQAFHVLRPRGTLVVLSPYEKDQLFPTHLKKIFGRVHAPAAEGGMVFWCQREKDHPRRRHEVVFQARVGEIGPLRFVSRPGVFSYGRFDDGARALIETMAIRPGDRILDLGCGCGTNGTFAGLQSGPTGSVTFVDSNARAVALAEQNARANGLTAFQAVVSSHAEGLEGQSFDVVLANPPYYAQATIAQRFVTRSRELLKPGGRFYLVTKQPDQVGPFVAEEIGLTEVVQRRGYTVLCATAPRKPGKLPLPTVPRSPEGSG